MKINQTGIGIYKILIVVFLLALIFILALPQVFDLNKRQNTETCIKQMKEIKFHVDKYMRDNNQLFTGTVDDLQRSNYITLVSETECPAGAIGDKYKIVVDPETRKIEVTCANEAEYPDHVLIDE
jgi:competence protein ComGC